MHFLALAFLALIAGTLLLAKTRKEELGKFFKFVSWFFIVVGFLLFIGFIGGSICKLKHCSSTESSDCRKEMIMKNCGRGMDKCAGSTADKCKEACAGRSDCMQDDGKMKNCSGQMKGDSTKMPVPKSK